MIDRKLSKLPAFLLVFVSASFAGGNQSNIGVYLGWVGTFEGNRLEQGAALAQKLGFKTIRVPLVPSFEMDFGIGKKCHSDMSLKELASVPAYKTVLSNPAFQTIFLTIWDEQGTTCPPRDPVTCQSSGKNFLIPGFYDKSENRKMLHDQYADLVLYLYQAHHDTGKTFVISVWEGDNDIYCGAAWLYATNPEFRKSCNSLTGAQNVLLAYRQFLTVRQWGIDDGKTRAKTMGLKGMEVLSAVEFNSIRFLQQSGYSSVLDNVIPFIPQPDLFSYSAWESTNPANYGKLLADLTALQKHFNGKLVVGEFGFDRGSVKDPEVKIAEVFKAVHKAKIKYAIFWQIFDQPPIGGDRGLYGLFDKDGNSALVW